MSNLKLAGIGLLLLGVGAAIGRFSLPAKVVKEVVTEVKEVEVVKVVEVVKSVKQNDTVTIVVETRLPDGTIIKETKIVDKGVLTVDLSRNTDKSKETDTKQSDKQTITYNTRQYHIQLHALTELSEIKPIYGLSLSKQFLGPISIGLVGYTNKSLGGSIGLQF